MSTVDVRSKYLIRMVMAIEWQTFKTNYKKKVKKENRFSLIKKKKEIYTIKAFIYILVLDNKIIICSMYYSIVYPDDDTLHCKPVKYLDRIMLTPV